MGAPNAYLEDALTAVAASAGDDDAVRSEPVGDDVRPVLDLRDLRRRAATVEGWLIERPIAAPRHAVRRPGPQVPADLGADWAVAVLPFTTQPTSSRPLVARPPAGRPVRPSPVRALRTHEVPAWRTAPAPARVRRRVVAGVALLAAVVSGVLALTAVGGDGPPPAAGERPAPVASVAYVARPGDTLWSIAREIQPQGDVRPLVDELASLRHGAPLEPGDVVAWPPLPSGR
jgi:hypothetical protein